MIEGGAAAFPTLTTGTVSGRAGARDRQRRLKIIIFDTARASWNVDDALIRPSCASQSCLREIELVWLASAEARFHMPTRSTRPRWRNDGAGPHLQRAVPLPSPRRNRGGVAPASDLVRSQPRLLVQVRGFLLLDRFFIASSAFDMEIVNAGLSPHPASRRPFARPR